MHRRTIKKLQPLDNHPCRRGNRKTRNLVGISERAWIDEWSLIVAGIGLYIAANHHIDIAARVQRFRVCPGVNQHGIPALDGIEGRLNR
jgi:hypothetical protein